MQIASFILVNDKVLRQFETQLESNMRKMPSPQLAFVSLVPVRLQELGHEHTISIPFGSFLPLDQVAQRQHERIFSAFEDPQRPSRLGRLAQDAHAPIFYVSPGRVRDFVRELETLNLQRRVRTEDVELLLGRKISSEELPAITQIIEQFRHDLHQVYRDAEQEGKGVVVLVVNQPDEMTSDDLFPRAA